MAIQLGKGKLKEFKPLLGLERDGLCQAISDPKTYYMSSSLMIKPGYRYLSHLRKEFFFILHLIQKFWSHVFYAHSHMHAHILTHAHLQKACPLAEQLEYSGDWGSIPGQVTQRLKKWYLLPPCLTFSIIRYGSRVKWSNPGKGVALSPRPWCSSC